MMKPQCNKVLLLLILLLPVFTTAQHFQHQALLNSVKQTGFYRIPVTPELSAYMQTNFSDVRIKDDKGKVVPYIVRNHPPKWQNALFKPFPIVENVLNDSGNSEIIFKKDIAAPINKFWIVQRNANVLRQASVSGSNDQKNWFVIDQSVLLNDQYEILSDSNFQYIPIANSNYHFYKLVINNEKKDPLNVIHIGNYTDPGYATSLSDISNPDPTFSQRDSSNGYTYITVTQALTYQVSSLGFKVAGQKLFSRNIKILVVNDNAKRKKNSLTEVSNYTLSPSSINNAAVPLFKAKQFFLAIYNGDDPALEISAIHTYQPNKEIIAWLEKDKTYTLLMNAADATAPHYDLEDFRDSISAILQEVSTKEITTSLGDKALSDTSFPRKYIWLVMLGILLLLSFFTWKLSSEMRKPTNNQ